MKLLAYAPFLGVGMLCASDVTTSMPGMTNILQGGALGVLAWAVWYLLAKAGPAHLKALSDQREAFLKVLKEDKEALREDRRRLVDSVTKKS